MRIVNMHNWAHANIWLGNKGEERRTRKKKEREKKRKKRHLLTSFAIDKLALVSTDAAITRIKRI